MSMSCMCLATIDQFLAAQSNVRWYRFNNVKLARYIFLGLLLCLVFLLVPYLIYYDQIISASTGKVVCAITNAIFSKYSDYAQSLFVLIIIPMAIMTVFGLLAYRNVQNISYRTIPLVRRELDKQLTSMVLVQVFYNIPVMTPMLIATFYNGVAGSTLSACDRIKMSITINLCILWYYLFAVVNISQLVMSIENTKKRFSNFLGCILYLCKCIEKISSTIDLCSVEYTLGTISSTLQTQFGRATKTINFHTRSEL